MKVGVIGSGVVGQTLAAGFLKHGHEVEIGTRDPAKLKTGRRRTKGASVKSFAEAAAFGDVVVLAVAGEVALDALKQAGAAALKGKTVIDACNPIGGGPPVNGVLSFFTHIQGIADGAAAEGLSGGAFRQGLQFGRRWADGQSAFRRRQADDVHLRQRRKREKDRRGNLRSVRLGRRGHGRDRGGARDRTAVHARGASPASARATGRRTRSSCCANRDCGAGRRSAPLRRACDACSWLFASFLCVRR